MRKIVIWLLFFPINFLCMEKENHLDELFAAIKRGPEWRSVEIAQKWPSIINERQLGRRSGDTPLSYAAMYDRVDICKILLQLRAEPNVGDYAGITPLHKAHDNKIVEMLLKAGADPNVRTTSGIDVLCWSAMQCNVGKVKLLLCYGARVDPVLLKKMDAAPIRLEREIGGLLQEAYDWQLQKKF